MKNTVFWNRTLCSLVCSYQNIWKGYSVTC